MSKPIFVTAATILALSAVSAAAEEVLVGVQLPMTGAMASYTGPVMKEGIDIAVDKVAKEKLLGEGRTLRVIFDDDASDKTQSITLASKLCDADKVSVMVGPPTTVLASAAAPVAQEKGCPSMTLAVGKDPTNAGQWIFKGYDDPEKVMDAISHYMIDTAKPKSIQFVTIRDNAAAAAYHNTVVSILKSGGQTNITDDTILSNEADFTALATKIADTNPEILFVIAPPESSANLVIAARQAGLPATTKIMGADFFSSPAFAKIGGSAVEGAVFPAHYSADRPDALNQDFVKAYRAKFSRDPDAYSAIAYNGFMIAVEGIRKAGPNGTRQQIRDAMATVKDMPSVLGTGTVSINTNRSVDYTMLLVQNKGGRAIPLK